MLSNKKMNPQQEGLPIKFQFVFYGKGNELRRYPLKPGELTVGSGDMASVVLRHPSVNELHARIIMDDKGGEIIDFNSEYGIFINDKRVEQGRFALGDRVRIGAVKLILLEYEDEQEQLSEGSQTLSLTSVSLSMMNNSKSNNRLQLIDGEYCDIIFDDSSFTPLDALPTSQREFGHRDYIDFARDNDGYEYNPVAQGTANVLEVMISLNGNILSVDHLPIEDRLYRIGKKARDNRTLSLPCLQGKSVHPFIEMRGGNIVVHQLPGFKGRYLLGREDRLKQPTAGGSFELGPNDVISLEWKTVQIFIRHSQVPESLKPAPLLTDPEGEYKTISAIFGAFMSVLLLLLLVDTTRPVIKKENVVIYRPKPKPKLVPLPEPEVKEDILKPKPKPKPKVQASESAPPPPPEKKKIAKRNPPPPPPPVAARKRAVRATSKRAIPPPPKTPQRKRSTPKRLQETVKKITPPSPPPPVKKYSFSAKDKVLNLFQSAKHAKSNKLVKNTSSTNSPSTTVNFSRSNAKNKLPAAASSRLLGSKLRGRYDGRVDSKGLSFKKAVSSIYQPTPKVTMGSMDPELLRRLLQEYMPQFRHCYQQELQRNAKARGVIDVSFRIVGKGISNVKVGKKNGQVFGRKGVQCVANVLSLIDFPAPKGGGVVDVRQSMNFLSRKSGK